MPAPGSSKLENHKEEINDLLSRGLSRNQVSQRISEKYGFNYHGVYSFIKSKYTKDDLEVYVEKKEPYKVVDNKYYWKSNNGVIHMSVDFIDDLFFQYSKHGLNKDQQRIVIDNEIDWWEWHAIKSRLNLYKNSHIFSPHTVEITPREDYYKLVEEKMETLYDRKQHIVEEKFDKEQRKRFEKAIDHVNREKGIYYRAVAKLSDFIQEAETTSIKNVNINTSYLDDLVASTADWHIGAEVKGLDITHNFDKEIFLKYIKEIAYRINQYKAKRVYLFQKGDLIETFTGLNHIDSWKNIEKHGYGINSMIHAIELFEYFISLINNITFVGGVGGNHDRVTSSNKEDTNAQVAEGVFYFLKREIGKHINVEYKTDTLCKEIGNINYIVTHGHHKMTSEKNINSYVRKRAIKGMFNLVLSGHLHSRKVWTDEKDARWVSCPSLFTGNLWSERMGWDVNPGFYIIYEQNKQPKIIDEPLNIDE